MTREEAKDLLDNLIGFIEDNHGSDYDEALKIAIKALKQEPCEDCISRQAVLKPYQTLKDSDTICIWLLRKNIEQQPPVTPPQRWIPVSERLPNFNDIVLASADSDYDELNVILTVYNAEEYWFNGKIKAWMPKPDSYKAESEE